MMMNFDNSLEIGKLIKVRFVTYFPKNENDIDPAGEWRKSRVRCVPNDLGIVTGCYLKKITNTQSLITSIRTYQLLNLRSLQKFECDYKNVHLLEKI